jgi:hypothetical protein
MQGPPQTLKLSRWQHHPCFAVSVSSSTLVFSHHAHTSNREHICSLKARPRPHAPPHAADTVPAVGVDFSQIGQVFDGVGALSYVRIHPCMRAPRGPPARALHVPLHAFMCSFALVLPRSPRQTHSASHSTWTHVHPSNPLSMQLTPLQCTVDFPSGPPTGPMLSLHSLAQSHFPALYHVSGATGRLKDSHPAPSPTSNQAHPCLLCDVFTLTPHTLAKLTRAC